MASIVRGKSRPSWIACVLGTSTLGCTMLDSGDEAVVEQELGCDHDGNDDVFPGPTEPIEICAPDSGAFTARVTNPYFPLRVCSRRVLEGVVDGVTETVQITVLDEIERVAGVKTRVVEELHTEDGEVVEISYNYFAQAVGGRIPDGATSPRHRTVCYFGEDVDIFEEDGTISHEGAWRAGVAGARPGIIMPGVVREDQAYLQEVAPGVAEDRAWHVELDHGRLVVNEDTPLEPGVISRKVYRKGRGLVRDDELALVSVEQLSPADCVRAVPE
jgi:hypothetical protein